jgi:putative tryptophan/tyrosine transport system substrate-binding protein
VSSDEWIEVEKKHMKKKHTTLALCAMLLALCVAAEAQQPTKVPRIGYLAGGGSAPHPALIQALRELGYIEGKNIAIEFRSREGRPGSERELAQEFVRSKMDIIIGDGTAQARAAKEATSTIPIVMTGTTDPVGTGLIASLARPGGNVTGLSSISGDLGGKLLELLKEIVPKLSRVVVPGATPGSPPQDVFIKEMELPARVLKVHVIRLAVRGPEDYENIFRVATRERAQALVVRIPPYTPSEHRRQFVELVNKHRLPAIYQASNWIESGGLISYGADRNFQYQRAAVFVDKILKGIKPADIPVEQPLKIEFVVNLKAAKQIGLTIPPNVLARADRIIR